MCTGTSLCLCPCGACTVGARLQMLARIEAVEAVIEDMRPGELERVRSAAKERVRMILGKPERVH